MEPQAVGAFVSVLNPNTFTALIPYISGAANANMLPAPELRAVPNYNGNLLVRDSAGIFVTEICVGKLPRCGQRNEAARPLLTAAGWLQVLPGRTLLLASHISPPPPFPYT